jgi:Ca2+-transporting ATPase
MSTLHTVADGTWVATKGATDAIIPMLDPRDATVVAGAEDAAARFASDGYRVLAIAERWVSHAFGRPASIESDLRLLGIVAMADPPRVAAEPAISACRGAGITTVMITGDDPRTAGTIARQLGIPAEGPALVTGAELDRLDDPELAERVTEIGVYARTTPEHKLRIVDAWKTRGAVVAMTGDGVNDAPALRRADIGVAMGIAGTEVSKEAADMVLADDDFATIVRAVEEGRRIYDNIRRFLRYMLATNSGEIWLWVMAFALGLPIPLLPLQILWINLVTDGLPAIALGVEPVEPDAMRRPPRPRDDSIWAHGLWQHAVWVGLLIGVVGVGIEVLGRHRGMPWRTMVFTAIAFLQLGHAIAVRSERESVFHLGWRSNPWIYAAVASAIALQLLIIYVPVLQRVFDTVALSPPQLGLVVVAGTITFWAVELEKFLRRRRSPDG